MEIASRSLVQFTNRLSCQICGRRVSANIRWQLRHATKYHPEMILSRLLPLVTNPVALDQAAREFASFVRQRFGWRR